MLDSVTHVEIDESGNIWYLSSLFGNKARWKVDYNMSSLSDKSFALSACTPLYNVLEKIGSMMSRGQVYVVDEDGNERRKYSDVRNLLLQPNPIQGFRAFVKNVEINLRLFGFCPLSLIRGYKDAIPSAMWILPPEYFHLEATGNLCYQDQLEDVVSKAYLQWGGRRIVLQPWEYLVIYDGIVHIPDMKGRDISFPTASDGLSRPVSNWMAAMSASHTLLVNGGPKGILCGGNTDTMENTAISPKDEDEIRNKFKEKYGLVGKEYPILVTRKQLNWIPLDFDADKLKLHEEDSRCTTAISNAFGINPNLFSDAKYDNQESAKTSAYQDVVIPDSQKISDSLTSAICPEGAHIKIDFSSVECLQSNKEKEANTLLHAADALERLMSSKLITPEEARKEIARYIEIDPDNPKGEFRENELAQSGNQRNDKMNNEEEGGENE